MPNEHPADYLTYRLLGDKATAICDIHGPLDDLDPETLNMHGKHQLEWVRSHDYTFDDTVIEPAPRPTVSPDEYVRYYVDPAEPMVEPIPTSDETEAYIDRWRKHYDQIVSSMGIPPRALNDD